MFGEPFPWVYVDGELVREPDARVSVHANALSYGTGTFEGIRAAWNAERGELYLLEADAHYERMARSARILGLPSLPDDLVAASVELLRRNEVRGDAYLRPLYVLAEDGLAVRMHGYRARLSIAVTPVVGEYIDPSTQPASRAGTSGVRCMVSSWRRAPDAVIPGRAKVCGSYVGPALAKSEAIAAGYDEAIMLNLADRVAEGTTSNVLLRRGSEWITPPVTEDILEGITRAQVIELLGPVTERSVQRSELYVCDELLLCGTAALVAPVVSVDGRPVGDERPGSTTLALLESLRAIARRADDRHPEWTIPVHGGEQAGAVEHAAS